MKIDEKMATLTLRGKPKYIQHMFEHLKKEHPSTRRRMKARGIKKK